MIRITNAAQEHFAKLLSTQEPGTQIRVFVINPGTPNAECGVSYCLPNTIDATDTELKFDTISAYIDNISAPYLQDAEINFVTDKLGSKLTLKAPNVKMHQVSDDAPLIERVEFLLLSQINPQLASHGGQVKLIGITNDMFAILHFSGGCNGCSMVDYTLKTLIEKKLLERFPELKGVRDSTEHHHGKHSYY
ncbi:Fe/S biogenesis protein nfuA [Candidatus Moranella endobia PCVAL]|uniref:Fe/S biogenesis protein NfuA n=1 Tax=Moranella endobia (strain PCIT) TaxID=903503 RepID=F7XXR5_MOREP|nr:Fe-S biogenesis protein NfuA [Candidatus Moranella endobia]AEI74891.1 putative IscR-regulated protein YhgI [Candidatus Moranella endobia PCIT]AGJ61137.1 Fe/S biogenesis protein nfuA [Candidatus Moranella endobia PCVAL]